MTKLVLIAIVLGCLVKSFAADVWINATPNGISGGSGAGCPGTWTSQAAYLKSAAAGWGWAPDTNTTIHTVTDTNNMGAKLYYLGRFSDNACATNSVTLPATPPSPKYRFTVFFPMTNAPTGSYWIKLTGFNP